MKHLKKYEEIYFGNSYLTLPTNPVDRNLNELRHILEDRLKTRVYVNFHNNNNEYYFSLINLDYINVCITKNVYIEYNIEYFTKNCKSEETFQLVDITKKEYPGVEELVNILQDLYDFYINKDEIEFVLDDNYIDIGDIRLEYLQDLHKYNEEIEELKNKYDYLFNAKDMGLI